MPLYGRTNGQPKNSKHAKQEKREQRENRPNDRSSSSPRSFALPGAVNEDFDRSKKSRATGYMGLNSEVVWMQHLNSQASKQSDERTIPSLDSQFQLPIDDSIASMNYHLDYQNMPALGITNAFVLPPKTLADRLFRIYLEKAHESLPIIRPDLFSDQYKRCYSERLNPGRTWLAVFNMVLAIACALSRLSAQELPHGADESSSLRELDL